MTSRISSVDDNSEWKRAYLDAILEKDRRAVIGRIEVAKQKMASRQRELMTNGGVPCEEVDAIHDAHYMLTALQNSLPYREEVEQRTAVDGRVRMLIMRGYKPKDAVEIALKEIALECRNDEQAMAEARAAADQFLQKIRDGLI